MIMLSLRHVLAATSVAIWGIDVDYKSTTLQLYCGCITEIDAAVPVSLSRNGGPLRHWPGCCTTERAAEQQHRASDSTKFPPASHSSRKTHLMTPCYSCLQQIPSPNWTARSWDWVITKMIMESVWIPLASTKYYAREICGNLRIENITDTSFIHIWLAHNLAYVLLPPCEVKPPDWWIHRTDDQ